jgi:uncharacterized protein YukE
MTRTNFSAYTDGELAQMLLAGDPPAVTRAAEAWSDVARLLFDQAVDIEDQLERFQPYWTGDGATAYRTMIASLAAGVRQVAELADATSAATHSAADALRTARTEMAAAVSPLAARYIGAPSTTVAAVLTKLADGYLASGAAMPAMPDAAAPPTIAEMLSDRADSADRVDPDDPRPFRDVYPSGLASAAAALGGRFPGAVQHLVASPAVQPPPQPPPPGVAGAGGADPPTPTANPALAGARPAPAGMPGIAAAPAGMGATPGMMGGFYPPMMPPMGMGAGGFGDAAGRNVPPWLVGLESEELFGVYVNAVLPVIGEPDVPSPPTGLWT